MTVLALFDLDHTLLSGDSDVLWCEFLMEHDLLDRAEFQPRNDDMARRYGEGSVSAADFCDFYVSTLAGRSLADWRVWCERFLSDVIEPRIPASARSLVESHRALGHHLVMTTATNRVLTELTAQALNIADLLATEVEVVDGVCSGRTAGVLNMREGKVTRLHAWLAEHGLAGDTLAGATFYSDSINDLPLLQAVGKPVVVDPDARLRERAVAAGWPIVELSR